MRILHVSILKSIKNVQFCGNDRHNQRMNQIQPFKMASLSSASIHSSHVSTLGSNQRSSSDRIRQNESKKKEIYKYLAPWTVYAMNWSVRKDKKFRIAIGSFIEDYRNKVQIIQLDEDRGDFVLRAAFEHPYPPTKMMWVPDQVCSVSLV